MSLNTGFGELLGDQNIFQGIPDDQPSTEKIVLISGGTKGIGLAAARKFLI